MVGFKATATDPNQMQHLKDASKPKDKPVHHI